MQEIKFVHAEHSSLFRALSSVHTVECTVISLQLISQVIM